MAMYLQDTESELIPENKYILLIDNRKEQRLLKISAHRKFNWRKTQINLQELKKHPFYQLLEVCPNNLKPIQFEVQDEADQNQEEEKSQLKVHQIDGSNKEMYILEHAQKLKTDQIQKMKKEMNPKNLIDSIVENNEQFEQRTVYSKEKYLKKKQRKYIFNFHAQPTNIENLHAYYFKDSPKMIGGIRWDMLALMLLYGGPYHHTLIGEKSKGILLGSILTKGAEHVHVANFQEKGLKNYPIVENLNIPHHQAKEKTTFSAWKEIASKKPKNSQNFDSFLLLGNYDFSAIVETVQGSKSLSSNCSVCFFCESSEPLLECYHNMRKERKNYVNVKIYDSWCRQYQVLTNRTHPMMSMNSRSGYILTAQRVLAE